MKKTLALTTLVTAMAVPTLTGCSSSGSVSPYFSAGVSAGFAGEHRGVVGKDVDPHAAGIYDAQRTNVYQHTTNASHASGTGPKYDPLRVQRD